MKKTSNYIIGILRILIGLIFLWAFFDKLIGLGFATPYDKGWIEGNSPTYGFLKNATKGPFATIFQAIAGNIIVDILFMVGLLLIGLALIIGIMINIASISGSLMMFLMWLVVLPPKNHPFIDEHIIYIFIFILFIYFESGKYLGFGEWWNKKEMIKNHQILK